MSDDTTVPQRPGELPTRPQNPDDTLPRKGPGLGNQASRKLGRYVLLDLLGSGGMGEVYAAFDPTLDRKVALKLLFEIAEAGSREQMLSEARALARLNHPNVVAVHEVGEEDGRAYLALEYVDGESLDVWQRSREHPWREILDVYLEAGRGLHAAHLAGLVHRDFKPANVMIRQDGRVQLLDFGIARNSAVRPPANASSALTNVAGTPGFMSPEQLMGHRLDARSDQFSFCAALYEALCGVLPFGNAADEPQLIRVMQQLLRAPTNKRDLPRALLPLLKRGLSYKPEERFASMGELMRQLKFRLPADRRMMLLIAGLSLIASTSIGAAVLKPKRAGLSCAPEHAGLVAQWKQQRQKTAAELEGDPQAVLPQMDAQLAALGLVTEAMCSHFAMGAPGEQLAKEQRCVSARQREFLAAVNAFAESPSEGRQLLDEAVPPQACLNTAEAAQVDVYERLAPARRAVADANRAWLAGDWLGGLGKCDAAEKQARALDSPELRSAALRLKGLMLERLGEPQLAEQTLHLAARAAEGATDESRAAAWVSLARVVGIRQQRTGDGQLWAGYAEESAGRFPQRKELNATLQLAALRMSSPPDALARFDALAAQLGPGHALSPVVQAERARKLPDFDRAYDLALDGLTNARPPVVPTLLGVADALENLPPHPALAARLLTETEKRLGKQPGAALVRLYLARVAREAGAVEAARDVAVRVLVEAEQSPNSRPTFELAQLELGICQLTLGQASEALSVLGPSQAALKNRQAIDGLWPARAVRAQLWEALALSRTNAPHQLPEAIAAAEKLGLEPQATAAAKKKPAKKK